MPPPALKTEKIHSPPTVLLIGSRHRLVEEIDYQLQNYPGLKSALISLENNDFNPASVTVLIHFVGFDKPSLSQTLSATELLHHSLNFCLQTGSKFILVVSNVNLPVCRTAVTLLTQFVKIHKLSFEVIETDPLLPLTEMAAAIIGKFIYHHQPKKITTPRPLTPYSGIINTGKVLKTPTFELLRLIAKWFLVLSCTLYLLFIGQLLLFVYLVNSAGNNYLNNRFAESQIHADLSATIHKLLLYQEKFLPGTRLLIKQLGFPGIEVVPVLNSFSGMLNNLLKFDIDTLLNGNTQWFLNYNQTASSLKSDLRSLYQFITPPPRPLVLVGEKNEFFISLFDKLATLLPRKDILLGINRPVTYLLLLQDSSSLQPTGGAIDTLITFTLEGGIIKDPQTYDARLLASQIVGNIDPPPEIRRLIGASGWSLLRANWDSDFSQSAGKIVWFFNKVLPKKIDFVIGLNDSFFPEILAGTGPINITGSPVPVTAGSFRSSKLADKDHRSGNNGPSFLSQVFIAILNKIKQLSVDKNKDLVLTALGLMEKRQIMLASVTVPLPELNLVGWGGGIHPSDCRLQFVCQHMYLYLVDTNLSSGLIGNPVNKQTTIRYLVNSGIIHTKLTVSMNYSDVIYKRIILPSAARIISAKIDNLSVLSEAFPLQLSPALVSWGFLMKFPTPAVSALEIEYEQPLLKSDSRFRLYIDIPNQPGVGDGSGKIIINYPKTWRASALGHPVVVMPGTLSYNTSGLDYQKVIIDFIKND